MSEFRNPFQKTAPTASSGKKPAVTRVRNTTSGSTPGKGGSMPTSYEEYRGKSAAVTPDDVADILDALQRVSNRMTDIEEGLADLKATTSGFDAKLTATRPFVSTPTPVSLKPLEDKIDGLSDVVPTVDKRVASLKGDMGAMEAAAERHIDDVVDHAARKLHDEFVDALAGLKEDLKASIDDSAGSGATIDLTGLEKRLTAAITASTASSVETDVDRDLDKTEFYDSVEGADFCQGFMLGKKFHLLREAETLLGQPAEEAGYKTVVGRFVNGEFAGLSDERHLRAYQALKKGAPAAPTPMAPPKKATKPVSKAKVTAATPEKKAVPASGETPAPTVQGLVSADA